MKSIKKLKEMLTRKAKGQGDLIASLFVILALTVFVLVYINSIGDIYTRNQLDQVARKYILRMESSGELSNEEETALKQDLMAIKSVKEAVGTDSSRISVVWNNHEGSKGYGSTITLKIECPAIVTNYNKHEGNNNDQSTYGSINGKLVTFTVTKQSTAKY